MASPRLAAVGPVCALALAAACATGGARTDRVPPEAARVEVIRTAYGVPHIYADDFRALGYALGYLQLEDYGDRVPYVLLGARGERARYEGPGFVEADILSRPYYRRAVETYSLIDAATREVYEGFAAGVNRYVARHPGEFPAWMPPFDGRDVAAAYVYRPSQNTIRRWVARLSGAGEPPLAVPDAEAGALDEGSSVWALAPERTASGAPILLRNPHLSWNAGYWEAHAVVRDRLDFYGDFRIGGPLGIVGGFNRHLAFASANNDVDTDEVYALDVDPGRAGHYLFDGRSVPVAREPITVTYADGEGQTRVTRERLTTPLGPVIYQGRGKVYVLRAAEDGAFRGGDQFLRMMRARSLDEWTAAMRLRAHPGSNFVYADAAGHVLYLWNAAIPDRPHPAGGDRAVPASRMADVWTRLHAIDELPQLLNPPGGYVRNENDAPWLTNRRRPLRPADYPPYFEAGGPLSLRSQHSVLLLEGEIGGADGPPRRSRPGAATAAADGQARLPRLSLEDVVRLKHSDRMLLADRVKDDLVAAVRAALDTPGRAGGERAEVGRAVDLIARWDNSASASSRGAVLFAEWWRGYEAAVAGEPFAVPWQEREPVATPRGLADPALAADRFAAAVHETAERFGSWDVPWGEVHRVRRGDVDEPVSGCPGALGCFRVLNFAPAADGRRVAAGGDGWVLAVELGDPPRAVSILAYGQSADPASPHHDDQAALFAQGRMKPVAYTRADVERAAIRRYRPGLD